MAAPIRVSTDKYTKSGQIDIDGNIWNVKLPGAGTELRMGQVQREAKACEARIKILESKIDDGKASDEEIDRYEELCAKSLALQKESMAVFLTVFNDGTKENNAVKKWLDETPTAIQFMVFEDVKKGGEAKNESRQESSVTS